MGKKQKKVKKVEINEEDNKFSLFEVIIIILISVIFGIIIGYSITYGNSNLSRVRSDTYLGEVVSAYNNIVDNYYDDLDEKNLSEAAIKGMISSLDDPYSSFLDEGSTSSFNESVDGKYVGIGIAIEYYEEYNRITSIMDDSPAMKAGLEEGDIILSVDNKDCHNLYPEEINQFFNGKNGSEISLEILRGDDRKTFTLKRTVIEIENVSGKVIDNSSNKIGYIKINIFASNSYEQFDKVFTRLEKKNIDSLIIDIRDNPGGHLHQAEEILNVFFDKKTVLYQTKVGNVKRKIYATTKESKSYPVIVLINGETASSAEVVAACFQDNYKNVHLLGSTSYGKGNVQKSISLSTGTSIKFTIEEWLTPKGKSVHEKGIVPDIVVEQSPVYYVEYKDEYDIQLERAIEILKES